MDSTFRRMAGAVSERSLWWAAASAPRRCIQVTRELAAAGVRPDVFFGFRDAPYCMEEYRSIANLVKVSTDTGAVGFHGFVTQLYDPADYDAVLVCGPTVMMKNAARLLCREGHPLLREPGKEDGLRHRCLPWLHLRDQGRRGQERVQEWPGL